jgi:hypothetical protein
MEHVSLDQAPHTVKYSEEGFIELVGRIPLLAAGARQMCLKFYEEHHDLVIPCLPESLTDLSEAIGFNGVLDLVNDHGGRRIYLPTQPDKFLEQTGLSVPEPMYSRWRELADTNGQIDIPCMWGLFLALRRAAIQLAIRREWAPEVLRSTFGLSVRQLKTYRNSSRDKQKLLPHRAPFRLQ